MGQDWALANLDGKIRIRLCLGRGCHYLGDTIFDMLRPRKLVDADDVLVETRGTFLQRQPLSSNPRALFTLPNELIDVIFTHVDDWIALVFLAVTCRDLWNIGVRHLLRVSDRWLAKSYGSAIGQRLIYMGDYNDKDFFPPGVHIPEAEVRDLFSLRNTGDLEEDTNYADIPRVYTNYRDERDVKTILVMEPIKTLPHSYLPFRGGIPAHQYEWQNIQDLLNSVLPIKYGTEDQSRLILRNLSKREYVTGAAMAKFNKDMKAQGRPLSVQPCLGFTVFSRIIWSRCSNGDGRHNYTGVWAGDRFDIVGEDELERDYKKEFDPNQLVDESEGTTAEWHDVSREVVTELEKDFFPPN
ncbi:hypothetical protein EV121DRAFT_217232 [Schizophyllum commune]